MLNLMFWSSLGLIGVGGISICGEPGPVRKSVGIALSIAGVMVGLATAVLDPLG